MPSIQIKNSTKHRLDIWKKKFSTYDETITLLMKKYETRQMFGSAQGIGPWRKEYRMKFRNFTFE